MRASIRGSDEYVHRDGGASVASKGVGIKPRGEGRGWLAGRGLMYKTNLLSNCVIEPLCLLQVLK